MLSPLHGTGQKPPNPPTFRQTDRDYEPKEEEVISYAYSLGFQLPQDNDLLHISREGLTAPVPTPWKMYHTENDELFYYHPGLMLSVWEHPLDEFYRLLYSQAKSDKRKRELLKKENKIERERVRDLFWKRKREMEEVYEKRIVQSKAEKEEKLQALVSSRIEDIKQKQRNFSPIGKGNKDKDNKESLSDIKSKNGIVIETLKKENEQRLIQLEKELEEKKEKVIRRTIKELKEQGASQIIENGSMGYEGVSKEEEQEYRDHLEASHKEHLNLVIQELDDQRRIDRESVMKGLGEEDRDRIQKLARSLGEKYKAEVERFEEYKMQKEEMFEQEMVLKNRDYEKELAVEKENMMNDIRKNFQKLKDEQEEKELRLEELHNELDYYFDISPTITDYKTIKQKSHSKLKELSDILGQKEQFLGKLDQYKSRLHVEVSVLKGLVEEDEETSRADEDCNSSNKLLEYLNEELTAREQELMVLRSEMREIKPSYQFKQARSASVSSPSTQWDLIKEDIRDQRVNRDPDYVTEIFDDEMSLIKAGYSNMINGNTKEKPNLMKRIVEIENGIKDQISELEKNQQRIKKDLERLENTGNGKTELNFEMTLRMKEVLEEKLSSINRNLEHLKKLSKWTQTYLQTTPRKQIFGY